MKTIFKFLPRGKKSALRVFRKKPIKLPSGKLQKLPAQKATGSFVKVLDAEKVKASQRAILGDVPEYMNMSSRAIGDLAAESLAIRTANKKFFSSLSKGLKRSRLRTATGIKGRKLKVKTPTAPSLKQKQAGIFKGSGLPASKPALKLAKSKGAMKAYRAANVKSADVFRKSMEKLTGRSKSDPMRLKSVAAKRPLSAFEGEKAQYVKAMRDMGFDVNKSKSLDIDAFDDTYNFNKKIKLRKKR